MLSQESSPNLLKEAEKTVIAILNHL